MLIGHGLLDGMKGLAEGTAGLGDALDGGDGAAVDGGDGGEARINGTVDELLRISVEAGDDDGARAAAALSAAELRSGEVLLAKVFNDGLLRVDRIIRVANAIDEKGEL